MEKRRLDGMRVGALAVDGFEQVELTVPREKLQRLGAEVEVISLRPGKIRGMNLLFPGKSVAVDRLLEEVDPADYDALLLPGGFVNPDLLRQSEEAKAFVRAFDERGGPIAVLCHGPWLLVSAGRVRGRRLAAWPGIQDDIKNAGGEWVDAPLVRDRNWVSSRSPQDLIQFTEGMVALFAEHVPAQARPSRRSQPRPLTTLAHVAQAAAVTVLVGAALAGAAGIARAALRA